MEIRRRISMARSTLERRGRLSKIQHHVTNKAPTSSQLHTLHPDLRQRVLDSNNTWSRQTECNWDMVSTLFAPHSVVRCLKEQAHGGLWSKHNKTAKPFLRSHYAERNIGEFSHDWEINRKKGRGRPRNKSLVDNMRQWLAPNINTAQLIQRTQGKDLWHQVVANIRTEHGTWREKRW